MRLLTISPLAGCAGLAIFLCCAAAMGPAGAQTMAQPGPGTMVHHPAPPPGGAMSAMPNMPAGPAKPDDPAKVAAAKAFIIAYHPRQDPAFLAKILPRFLPKMIEGAKKRDPKVDVKKFVAERTEQIIGGAAKSLDEQAHIVSRHFTLQELNGLTAFYRAGLGKRLTDEMPRIQGDMMREQRRKMLLGTLDSKETPAAPPKSAGTPHK